MPTKLTNSSGSSTKSSSGNASPLALHGKIAHSKCPEESQQGYQNYSRINREKHKYLWSSTILWYKCKSIMRQ